MSTTATDYAKERGKRIRFAREQAGLTQHELAARVFPGHNPDARRNDIIRYEKGRVTPGVDTLRRIAVATGTSVAHLLGEEDDDEESDQAVTLDEMIRRRVRAIVRDETGLNTEAAI